MAKSPSAPPRPNLREPRPGSRPTSPLDAWLRSHPEGLALVDEWLDLRAAGETMWSLRDVLSELMTTYGMPKVGESGFRGWLERNRSALYRKGQR